jgi:hypothetical protein
VSCIVLSIIFLFLLFSCSSDKSITIHLAFSDLLMFLYLLHVLFRSGNIIDNQENIIKTVTLVLLYVSLRIMSASIVRLFIPLLVCSVFFMIFHEYYLSNEIWKGFFNQ